MINENESLLPVVNDMELTATLPHEMIEPIKIPFTPIPTGCEVTEWTIKSKFVQEIKVEPSILIDVTGWTNDEIKDLYNRAYSNIINEQLNFFELKKK